MKPIDLFSALDCVSEEYLYEASAYRQEQGSHKEIGRASCRERV